MESGTIKGGMRWLFLICVVPVAKKLLLITQDQKQEIPGSVRW